MFFLVGLKSRVIRLLVLKNIPQSYGGLFILLAVKIFHLLFHFSILENCVLHRNQTITDSLGVVLDTWMNVL